MELLVLHEKDSLERLCFMLDVKGDGFSSDKIRLNVKTFGHDLIPLSGY
jgi:hypothetical protein